MMTKEEVKRYIELHGDARKVVDTIKEMQAEGIDVTEQALDERLMGVSEDDYLDDIEELADYTPPKKKFDFKVVLIAVASGVAVAVAWFVVGVLL